MSAKGKSKKSRKAARFDDRVRRIVREELAAEHERSVPPDWLSLPEPADEPADAELGGVSV